MNKYIEKVESVRLPAIALLGLVLFPGIPTSFELSSKEDIAACLAAKDFGNMIFVTSRSAQEKNKNKDILDTFFHIGVVAKIKQAIKLPNGNYRLLVEGGVRAELESAEHGAEYPIATCLIKSVYLSDGGGIRAEALMRETVNAFQEFIKYMPKISNEIVVAVSAITEPGMLADFIAANVVYKFENKRTLLAISDPLLRLERLCVILEKEAQILKTEASMHAKVKQQIDKNQKEYYLREQLKVIQNELGSSDGYSDIDEYGEKIHKARLPENIEEKLYKELSKLEKMPYSSAESTVIRNYLDTCLEIPWTKTTKDRYDISAAKKILDKEHYGLEKVKDRILEFLSVKKLSPKLGGQLLCLVGPPGVGKSSVAVSVAHALGRKFARISLGGVRDEADIRGHRKTYIASMPGRIINALVNAKSMNPVILLDEIDKMSSDAHGDPASALLEVLDKDQNRSFRDHFVELPVDISECVFIATANTLDTVPRPLLDRMEVIEIASYTQNEKINIFKNHILEKEAKRHGLKKSSFKFTDEAISLLIERYTKEAGVRNLARKTAELCRKAARRFVEDGQKKFVFKSLSDLEEYLKNPPFKPELISDENKIGVVNGLAWTSVGGEMLEVEISAMEGTGKCEITGMLGDVMKESAHAALTCIRTRCGQLGIDKDFYKNRDIHIHVPEGAVPKDGPSAGITMATAIASELGGIYVRSDVAMTGEITLRGRVLPIGGLREKTMAAYTHGIKTVIIPYDNLPDLEEIDQTVRESINFVAAKTIDDVFDVALVFDKKDVSVQHIPECVLSKENGAVSNL